MEHSGNDIKIRWECYTIGREIKVLASTDLTGTLTNF